MKKLLIAVLALFALLLTVFFLGPKTQFTPVSVPALYTGSDPKAFAKTLNEHELNASGVKPRARAEVVFAKADSSKTDYVILYLHGFSASRDEGSPVIDELGQRYEANIYWSRLTDHGLQTEESFANANPFRWREEAARFLDEAAILGDNIILAGTSTGATLGIDLAARYPEKVKALLLFSPNIALANPAATLINGPWGLELSRKLSGGNYRILTDLPPQCADIWTGKYRIEGLVALEELLETTMIEETFKQVTAPTLMAYYFKDEDHQDNIISVEAATAMMSKLSTPENQRRSIPLSSVSGHVITTDCRSTGIDDVRRVTWSFLEEVLHLKPSVLQVQAGL